MKIINITKVATVALVSALALAGCSANTEKTDTPKPDSSSTSQQATKLTADDAAKVVTDYYTTWFSETDTETYKNLSSKVDEVIGSNVGDNSTAASDPVGYIKTLPADTQKKLADETEQYNKAAKFYNTDSLSDAERASVNIMNVSLAGLFASNSGGKIDVKTDSSKIKLDSANGTAEVPFSAITLTYDGKDSSFSDSDGFNLKLVDVNGEWKIDGKAFLDSVLNKSASSDGSSDSSSSSDGK